MWGWSESGAAGTSRLPRVAPESVGVDPRGILAFVEAVEKKVGGLHSFMLLRHGKVAAEAWWAPYAPQYRHTLFSLSKSFTSTAVGLAVADGKLTVDSPVVSFCPGELPAKVGDNLAAMKVRHLLTMSTGHEKDATEPMIVTGGDNWVKGFLSLSVEHAPGSKMVYNSAATYMLSAIVQKVTGRTLLDYLKPRLFGPLGIKGQTWEACPRGISAGGWGLSIKTEDIARFGQLYLQKGRWNGRQLIPESWVADATSKQVSTGDPASGGHWNQGYGYQFWRWLGGNYRGDGAFGQFCIVLPEKDAVLVITSGAGDMGAIMTAAWDHLVPAIRSDRIPENRTGVLPNRLHSLAVKSPEGSATSDVAKRVSGRTYRFDPNELKVESATLMFRGNRCLLTLRNAHGQQRIESGFDTWVRGPMALIDRPPSGLPTLSTSPIASRGAWSSDDTYTMQVCFYEAAYIQTVAFKFNEDRLEMQSTLNVSFGPTERPVIRGRLLS